MTLEEAYIMRKQECKTLQRENSKLLETIEQLRKGAYSDPDKIEHIRQISELTREIQKKDKIIERYKKLHEEDQLKVYELNDKNIDLEEKIRSLEWQVECAKKETGIKSRTAKEEADAKIKALSDEVARLTALLNQDGTNTGLPTSKTPLNKKKVIPNSREKSDKPRGGQTGHAKHSMEAFSEEEVTQVIQHELDICPECGGKLTQAREIPKDELDYEVKVVKKRHVFREYICNNCGKTIRTKDAYYSQFCKKQNENCQ